MSKANALLKLLLKIALAAALITFLVRSGHLDPKELWSLMTPLNVAIAMLLVGMNTLLATWRWVILLRARGFSIKLRNGLSLYLIGIFFNHALPGAVGGDVVRGFYLVRENPGRRLDAILSIFIDRILGLYSFFILTLLAVAWDFEFVASHDKIRWVALTCALVFIAMTLFFIVTFSHRLSHLFGLAWFERRIPPLHKLVQAFQGFGKHRGIVALSVAVSVMAQLFTMIFFYQLALMSGETDITWKAVLFAVPMGFLVTAIPIAPAGIGVGQVAFLYLFQAYLQKQTAFGATAITAFQLTLLAWGLVGAVLYLKRKRPHDLEEMAHEADAIGVT